MDANCPRCENGTISAFRHVANGVCFLCGGTTRVNVAASAPAVEAPRKAGKCIEIEGVGAVEVTRDGGDFRVETNSGWMIVAVNNGQVRPVIVSDGLRARRMVPTIVAALTARHRAA